MTARCPVCKVPVPGAASACCPKCHAERVKALERPPVVGLEGDEAERVEPPHVGPPMKYCPPPERVKRPGSSGRRVFRNEKGMQ